MLISICWCLTNSERYLKDSLTWSRTDNQLSCSSVVMALCSKCLEFLSHLCSQIS